MNEIIYKVVTPAQWEQAQSKGIFEGAPVDIDDGYIHFSTREQLGETVRKHFAGKGDLILLCVDANDVGSSLKWEPSRGGALFPHLYSDLDTGLVQARHTMAMLEDGSHELPDEY